MSRSPLHAGTSYDLIVHRSFVCCHNHCESMCATVCGKMLFPCSYLLPLALINHQFFYSNPDVVCDIPFRAEHFIVSYFLHIYHCGSLINCHLLEEEASLMRIERRSHLWIENESLRLF